MNDLMRLGTTVLFASFLAVGCDDAPDKASAPTAPAALETSVSAREMLATTDPKGDTAVDKELESRIAAARANPRKLDAWVLVGRSWVQKARNTGDPGYYINADAAAEMALELEPQSPIALNLRGLVLLNGHRFAAAKALAETILERDSDDAMALGTLCDAELELGNIPAAIAAADKMVSKKPDLPSYSRVSYLRWLSGDAAGAIEGMRLAFDAGRGQRDPEPGAWSLVQSANYFWHLGDLDGAAAGYDLALEYSAGYLPALVGRARVSMARGKPAAAVALLEKAYAEQPTVETAWLLGDARAAAGDASGAEAAWTECVRLGRQADPRTLALFFATKNRDLDEALKLAKAELDKRPGPHSRDAYAFALLRAGRAAEAKEVIASVLKLGVQEPAIQFHGALIAIATGDASGGRKTLRGLLDKTPHFNADATAEARRVLGE